MDACKYSVVTLIDDGRLDDIPYASFLIELYKYADILEDIYKRLDSECIEVCVVIQKERFKEFFHFKLYRKFLRNIHSYATTTYSTLLKPENILFESILHYGIIHRVDGPYQYSIPCRGDVSFAFNGKYLSVDDYCNIPHVDKEEAFLYKLKYGGKMQ